MCIENLGLNQLWETRNGSIVLIGLHSDTAKFTGTVLKSADPKFPIGYRFEYQSEMGHVLCVGNDEDSQDKCETHPLDAKVAWTTSPQSTLEAITDFMGSWVMQSKPDADLVSAL